MPKDTNIRSILIIGGGPIVIGQGCEFDYSGTQACRVLREEGYRVVLLNSNPATIMTDPELADRTYIEPITPAFLAKILAREQELGIKVDVILPTLGGQTALNCAMAAAEAGLLDQFDVRLIGASCEAIHTAEDRTAFRNAMLDIGLDVPRGVIAHTVEQAEAAAKEIGLPCVIRPAYTLGGSGSSIVTREDQLVAAAQRGLQLSRISEILIEESLIGWKEYELEVIRDRNDNVVVICSIENLDPMGVHTGDSITVAPAQTLTDREYQQMRDAAKRIIRRIGVETGGSNVQFAVNPKTGRQVVIEMNPRVSRSSALASKATGYPIAKVAAKLAVGYTLDEITNDITGTTPASFEPSIDYVVVKMPRWAFEKFPEADETLTTQMKSVGEAMAIGRTFKEAFQKCVRSMEVQRAGYGLDSNDRWFLAGRPRCENGDRVVRSGTPGRGGISTASVSERPSAAPQVVAEGRGPLPHGRGTDRAARTLTSDAAGQPVVRASLAGEAPPDVDESSASTWPISPDVLRDKLSNPCQGRPYYIRYAFKSGWTVDEVHELSGIDPWFLDQMAQLVEFEDALGAPRAELIAERGDATEMRLTDSGRHLICRAKQWGYSNVQLANALRLTPTEVSKLLEQVTHPIYRLVDTCAAEYEARTPYCYATHEPRLTTVTDTGARPTDEDELKLSDRAHVVVLGGGPNRIGQGIEFDYCCVHAAMATREMGFAAVMVNSNPETVSTDFGTSDVLFFEPLVHEDVLRIMNRISREDKLHGVIVQFGGQTPLNLAGGLKEAGVPILGTPPESINLAEDRAEFQAILGELSLLQPPSAIAYDRRQAVAHAAELGYPVLIRPSYVLGGRAMELCNREQDLQRFVDDAFAASDRVAGSGAKPSVLVDKFLLDATEVDVDAVADYRSIGDPKGDCVVCGVMEHIEEAGIHSGDSSCVLPPFSLSPAVIEELYRQTRLLAKRLGVCGLMNIQFAIVSETVYVLEVNPRASRTVPFVSKATSVPWAKVATEVMLGRSLKDVLWERGVSRTPQPRGVSIKRPVFPFDKFPEVDAVLGPEMRSTGEVMAVDTTFGKAFAKSQIAAGLSLPIYGNALVSVNDPDKPRIVPIACELRALGFKIFSTIGTHEVLQKAGIDSVVVTKQAGTSQEFLLDLINHGVLDLLINTPIHKGAASEEGRWRIAATAKRIPLITTLAGARAAVAAIRALRKSSSMDGLDVLSINALQDFQRHGDS